jgi:signal transduction histidine kinase
MLEKNWKIIPYVTAAFASIIIILITFFASPVFGKTASLLFFVLVISISTWFSGLIFGIFVVAFTVGIYGMADFYQWKELQSLTPLEVGLFLLSSATVGYIIEYYRKTDIVNDLKKKCDRDRKLIADLSDKNSRLQKEIKLRDEFLSIASHELKTPLTSMLLKIQVVLHSVRNVSLAKFSVQNLLTMLETAEQQVQRLRKMINDLLNTSLITTGKLDLEMKEADLTALVREVTSEFSEKLEKDGYELTLKAEKPIPVVIDKVRIEQVVTNLLTNAIKYGNKKPIDVEVVNGGHMAKVIIKDRGLGIDSKYKDHIFGLFGRGIEDKTYKGLGVGLFISNHIVQAHNGRITVDTRLNRGSTFTVELPIGKR